MNNAARQPAASSLPFYHHAQAERASARGAVRWVKVSWLGSLLGHHIAPAIKSAAKSCLCAIDDEDPRLLVANLRKIADVAGSHDTRNLANGAADAVERAMAEGAR